MTMYGSVQLVRSRFTKTITTGAIGRLGGSSTTSIALARRYVGRQSTFLSHPQTHTTLMYAAEYSLLLGTSCRLRRRSQVRYSACRSGLRRHNRDQEQLHPREIRLVEPRCCHWRCFLLRRLRIGQTRSRSQMA